MTNRTPAHQLSIEKEHTERSVEDGRGLVKCPSHPHLHPEHKVPEDRDSACLVHGCILSACSWHCCVLSKFWLRNSKQSKRLRGSRAPFGWVPRVRRSESGWPPGSSPTLTSYFLAHCASFNETFQFLFWTMFGMSEHSVVDMPQFLVPEFMAGPSWHLYHRHGDCAAQHAHCHDHELIPED